MGTIQNAYGRVVGRLDNDGIVWDATSRRVGRVHLWGEIRDAAEQLIGYVDMSGAIYSNSRGYLGKIVGATILDRNGNTVGTGHMLDPYMQTGGAALLLLL